MFLESKIRLYTYEGLGGIKIVTTVIFPELVNVMVSDYTYSVLSLVAEVGGYVGLFLGISVLQISGLMEALLRKLRLLADRRIHQRRQRHG